MIWLELIFGIIIGFILGAIFMTVGLLACYVGGDFEIDETDITDVKLKMIANDDLLSQFKDRSMVIFKIKHKVQ